MNFNQKKVIVVGPSGVGKTSITLRYINGEFCDIHNPTIGASYLIKKLIFDSTQLVLQVWDTAGQEKYKSMCALYFRSSTAVFDVTKKNSMNELSTWIEQVRKFSPSDILLFMVANKCDIKDQRAFSDEECREFAELHKAPLFFTSAKTGDGISEVFRSVATELLKKENSIPKSSTVTKDQLKSGSKETITPSTVPKDKPPQKKCCF